MNTIPVGVLGASGYAGRELCALIHRHPAFELAFATANEQRGQTAHAHGRPVTFIATEDAPLAQAAVVFSSLPHGASATWVNAAKDAGARVVDLSADLRPGNGRNDVPYGLPELTRAEIPAATIVANPGCYPTSILLAVAPLVEAGLIAPGTPIIANSASGVTGAGNAAKREFLFGEVAEDYRAYGIGNTHRHLNEMRVMLARIGKESHSNLVFTPHLLPVARGMLSTITVELREPLAQPMEIWKRRYAGEPFVELTDGAPRIRDVAYRNAVQIFAQPLASTSRPMLLVLSAIDNLMKGAAGQAVQNANLMFGLDEAAGLPV
ncbi:MAG: N-acetyl-gamma-glutamyl-phosphate reductase [Gemmatimonadaceae bacterium]